MKPSPITIAVSVTGIVLAVLGLYFGALLPYLKAQSFITAERRMASIRTIEEFERNFDIAFDLYSPVGDDELAKFLGNNILNIVAQDQPEDISRRLVAYIERRLFKDEVRHLLLLGQMYQVLWDKYGEEDDYRKSVDYFEKAHAIGPNLPPPLYRLLNLYALHGDKENFDRIGGIILSKWPQDEAIRAVVEGDN